MDFCVNVSTVFKEPELVDRFTTAKSFGFKNIEIQNPFDVDLNVLKLKQDQAGVRIIMINSYPGDPGDFGYACIPGKEDKFFSSLSKTIKYTFELNCSKVHILAGLKDASFTEEELTAKYIENLKAAGSVLEDHNVIGLIEPICTEVKEGYFLNSFNKAVDIIQKVNHSHIKLLLDIYHLHKTEGDVIENLPKFLPYAGHIQVSQEPGRKHPFTQGQIDYSQVFRLLQEANYEDFIGLEFYSEPGEPCFEWMKTF